MKTFELELRVYDSNTKRWSICLEGYQQEDIVGQWTPPSMENEYYSKRWQKYTITDDELDVFAVCTGYGASIKCEVLINGAKASRANTLIAEFDQRKPSYKAFKI